MKMPVKLPLTPRLPNRYAETLLPRKGPGVPARTYVQMTQPERFELEELIIKLMKSRRPWLAEEMGRYYAVPAATYQLLARSIGR